MKEKFYPREENLGRDCIMWNLKGRFAGCNYPKAELEGRTSCEGVIDRLCVDFLSEKRKPESMKIKPPARGQKPYIPAS